MTVTSDRRAQVGTVTLDHRRPTVTVPAGTTIWDGREGRGHRHPRAVPRRALRPVGVCRMCVVDIGGRVLAAACVRPCEEGMKVETASRGSSAAGRC